MSDVRLALSRALTPEELEQARNRLPGLQVRGLRASMAGHAVTFAPPIFRDLGVRVLSAEGSAVPPAPLAWAEVREDHLSDIRPEFRDWGTDYQKEALCWSIVRPGALLHHPTGSGKTYTAICWAVLVPGPVLIVTRAASRLQYARQVGRFTALRPFLCKPANEIRKKDQWKTLDDYTDWCREKRQRPVVVVGWEALSSYFADLSAIPWTSIVMDESHKGKSKDRWESVPLPPKSDPGYRVLVERVRQRGGTVKPSQNNPDEEVGLMPTMNTASCMSQLAKSASRRLATTATPVPDRVRDLWGQLDLIEPFQWGRYRDFALRYCDARPGMYGGLEDSGSSNLEELAARLTWVVHRVEGKVARAALPAKRRETWYIAQSEQVVPSGSWKSAIKAASKLGATAMLEIRLAMAASAKRTAILARVSEHMESKHKVVVFTARQRDCDELAESLRKLKGKSAPAAVWKGHGGDEQAERVAMLAEYVAHPGPCVLVGTGAAWGTAIDGLQCTDAAIFALLPYTPGDLDQWEGRFTRLGQDRPVVIYYPIAEGTADEHLASILLDKLPAVDRLAPTDSLDGAADALAGFMNNPAELAATVLSFVDNDDY